MLILADAYDRAQERCGDPRRAYRYGQGGKAVSITCACGSRLDDHLELLNGFCFNCMVNPVLSLIIFAVFLDTRPFTTPLHFLYGLLVSVACPYISISSGAPPLLKPELSACLLPFDHSPLASLLRLCLFGST
jgi:hypothetical protein